VDDDMRAALAPLIKRVLYWVSTNTVSRESGLPKGRTASALRRLEAAGKVERKVRRRAAWRVPPRKLAAALAA